jgi:CDP-diacylglycerol--glycerol-3-phosphate 3-phosphatidyltransferase
MQFSVPNILSLSRIIVAPVFLFLFLSKDPNLVAFSCVLFLIGALSDYFDGWYARKYNIASDWGVFIDPLADKILTSAGFIAYVLLGLVPFWMVLIIIIRDFSITFFRLFADSHNLKIRTSNSAKWKTFLQFVFLAYIQIFIFIDKLDLFNLSKETIYRIIHSDFTYYSILFLTLLTIYTFYKYLRDNKSVVNKLFGFEE